MRLAIIPARGGSKRIPRKNIREFAGKPMIGHAISAALSSGLFEYVVVSTDDPEIASIALEHGARIPFTRPKSLADDFTPTVPVIAHAITECENLGWTFDEVCCIYPCVPFLNASDLSDGLKLLQTSTTDYAFSVTEFHAPVQRAMGMLANGRIFPFFNVDELARTQDLHKAYYDAGQFYWGRRQAWLSNPRIHSCGSGLVIPRNRAIDIDTAEDWVLAEVMLELFRKNQTEN